MATPTIPSALPPRVALETTLLLHGLPRGGMATALHRRLGETIRTRGAEPALIGVVAGKPVVGMSDAQLDELLRAGDVPKLNTSNLGAALFRREHGATTVSATMELAAKAAVSVFATGGIGGVHRTPPGHDFLDVSSDLLALTRFPVAVVASGVKSILNVRGTREALETLGVPVIGYRCDEFPTFYRREPDEAGVAGVDARFDDAAELAAFVRFELARTNRGVLVCNPIPAEHELRLDDWRRWLAEAERWAEGANAEGRRATPTLLGALHEVSGGATLRANIELVVSNAELAARLAVGMTR